MDDISNDSKIKNISKKKFFFNTGNDGTTSVCEYNIKDGKLELIPFNVNITIGLPFTH